MDAQGVHIELVRDTHGYRACERIQREVWGFAETAVVPDHLIHMLVHAGGFLIGAFDGVGPGREMVGYALSTPGLWEGKKLRHHSLMTAVLPAWQDKGVGYLLKCAQRDFVLQQGIDLITWTFDPLESRNAHFNLNKLGGVVAHYLPNFFGELRDVRNRGVPTDRFLVQWHLSSPRVRSRLAGGESPAIPLSQMDTINRTQKLPSGLRAPAGFQLGLTVPYLLFEIPADFQALRKADMELARQWRMESRPALSSYIEEGYVVTGLFRQGDRSFLVLEKTPLEAVLERP